MNEPRHVEHNMKDCIQACLHCHMVCLHTAMNQCLNMGEKHVEADHFRLMMSCAEICQTSANFQLINSPYHLRICDICAEICADCAENCAMLSGMEECVSACRACADSCRIMAESQR